MRESRTYDLGGGREVTRVPTAKTFFAAVHESALGTSRRFVVTRKFGRYWRHSRPERAFSPDQLGRK
jgi:hypothetical protein